jgi:amino acid adenylation domain-containing protein
MLDTHGDVRGVRGETANSRNHGDAIADDDAIPGDDIVGDFAAIVSRYPRRPAIVHDGYALSYAGLGSFVQATARRLGPQPGVVGVLTSRTPATIVGLLAVLAAGGTYCPVDPHFPEGRRRAMLAAAGCRTLLATQPGFSSPPGIRLLDVAGLFPPEPAADRTSDPASDLTPEPAADLVADLPADFGVRVAATRTTTAAGFAEPAYILFTSGSSGTPKPVVTPRRAITVTVRSLWELFGLTSADRVLQFASLNWDTCLEEILPTLTTGAALVINGEAHTGSFPRFLRMIESERISVLDLPTAFWHELVNYLAEDPPIALPDCLRLVVIGGEAASPARVAEWCGLPGAGRVRLVNTYGCTETTLITHAVDLHGPLAPPPAVAWDTVGRVPIGRPLAHVREHIGADGELLVGGPALASGYRDLPEATAARFAPLHHPGGVPSGRGPGDSAGENAARDGHDGGHDGGERYFRTGDRVTRSPDGTLVHEGRLDNAMKVRGVRVDPGEVEAHIAGHPEVRAVAVAGVTVADHTTLAAYVVPGPHADVATLDTDVLSYLRNRVPGHLVPSRVTVVPALVYTASGKVDRARSHQRHAAAHHRVKEAPRNEC